MNLKTTIALMVLVAAGAGTWAYLHYRKPVEAATSPTLDLLQSTLTSAKLSKVEASRKEKELDAPMAAVSTFGLCATPLSQSPLVAASPLFPRSPRKLFTLEKKEGGEWTLPGNWPIRSQEIEQFVSALTSLRSRFAPISIDGNADLAKYGLDNDPLTIEVTAGAHSHILRFAEKSTSTRSFAEPTYVRLDNENEVIQLAPGVLAALNRTQEYFQQRRLFPWVDRVAEEKKSTKKVDELNASAVEIVTKETKVALVKRKDEWILANAHKKVEVGQDEKKTTVKKNESDKDVKKATQWKLVCSEDRLDEDQRTKLLRALPDLWAKKFVPLKSKSLEDCGLHEPEYTITVTRTNGDRVKLAIGKASSTDRRVVFKEVGGQLRPETEGEEYRFGQLGDNEQLFELNVDKLNDIAVPLDRLRDAQLARFDADDVRRLEIRRGDSVMVFTKHKEKDGDKEGIEKWRLEQPTRQDVEQSPVSEFITKIAGLQAREKQIRDDLDLKSTGLDKPTATIKLTLEEPIDDGSTTGDPKKRPKKHREITLRLAVKDSDKDKVFVGVDDWKRVNQLDNEIWKLAERSELAYRPRELWKLDNDAITKITLKGDNQPEFHLNRDKRAWRISGPFDAEVGGGIPDRLAEEFAHLKCERFERGQVKDFAPFGLEKPAVKISFTTKDGKTHAVEIGKELPIVPPTPFPKGPKDVEINRYARLVGSDIVFVLSDKTASLAKTDPSDYMDRTVLALKPDSIERIRYERGSLAFTLEAKGDRWHISNSPAGPFAVGEDQAKLAIGAVEGFRAEKFIEFGSKIDFAKYGLAKPLATITVTLRAGDKDKPAKPTEHVIELGSETKGGRHVRIDKKDAVVLIDLFLADRLMQTHLDFLDTRVLRFDADAVMRIARKMGKADLEMARREDDWILIKPAPRDADNLTIRSLLKQLSQLKAARIHEYPAKDLKAAGLETPSAVITLEVELDNIVKKHVIRLGDLVKDPAKKDSAERFAMIDDQKMIVVLSAELSRELVASATFFEDRNLASIPNIDAVEITKAKRTALFSRAAKGWEMTQPATAPAESADMEDLIRAIQRLRADEIVADKVLDAKKFGLDQPAAQWRFKSGTDEKLLLIVGGSENDQPGARRYAKLGDKNAVFLLNARLSARLIQEYRTLPSLKLPGSPEVTITIGAEKPFTIELKGDGAQLKDDPKRALNLDSVIDIHVTLERLKALHFVADAKPDLKQFGLAPPSVKIEMRQDKEKRELWLGSIDEKTKGYHALIIGTDAVFIIDPSAGRVLSRSLSAYLDSEKKKVK